MYRYAIRLTRAYPPDVRIFLSRLLPPIAARVPALAAANAPEFAWGNRYERFEQARLGKVGKPSVLLTRTCKGEAEFTDEWEESELRIEDFCPPNTADTLRLDVYCAESFLMLDQGDHSCSLVLETDSLPLFLELKQAIEGILKRFANAQIEFLP